MCSQRDARLAPLEPSQGCFFGPTCWDSGPAQIEQTAQLVLEKPEWRQ